MISLKWLAPLSLLTLLNSNPLWGEEFDANCANNEQAQALVDLIINDPGQQRTEIKCNPILAKAAAEKAKLMQERGLVAHNLGGSPNSFLKERGYKLPSYYGHLMANQVEAIAGGFASAEEVWSGFKGSEGHRIHLLGEHDFYRQQNEIGVAFIYEWYSPHVEYWVVYLTEGAEDKPEVDFTGKDNPNKSLFILEKGKRPD